MLMTDTVNKKDLTGREKLLFFGRLFLCLLLFDLATTGSGRYISLGWFSPRIVLALLAGVCALPLFLSDLRRQVKNPVNLLLLIFLLYLIFEAVRGRAAGNDGAVLRSDLMGFAWLALLPIMGVLLPDRRSLKKALDWLIAGASCQAAVCVLFNLVFSTFAKAGLEDFLEYYIWRAQWGTILSCEYGATRIFCRSSMMMVAALMLLLGRLMREERFSWKKFALFLLNFLAVFYTYTRSLYFALAVGLLIGFALLLVLYPAKRVLLRTLTLAGAFLLIVCVSDLVLRQGSVQYAFARCFHIDLNAKLPLPHTWDDSEAVDMNAITENTNETRDLTLESLKERIAASPVIGHGLGATSIRGANDEYFYHDMLMRCGVIGLILYLLPAVYALSLLIRRRSEWKDNSELLMLFAGLAAYLVATYYNPWMNAAIGISWYGLCVTASALPKETV